MTPCSRPVRTDPNRHDGVGVNRTANPSWNT